MKVMSFLFLFLLSSISFASEDTIKCYSTPALNNPEIKKLFSAIKNDILGTVPKFCRPNGPEQLGDNEQGAKDLTEFVEALKKSNPNGKDAIEIISNDSNKIEAVIFSTVKMVVLKKMWNQTKEDDQYALLLSYECRGMNFNKFEMHRSPQKIMGMNGLDSEKSYQQTLKACKSYEMNDLASYVTKDVLVESLLTLKTIFPKKFPEIVTNFCEILSVTDELIFKDDNYKDYPSAERNISSVDEFSIWLRSLYADAKVPSLDNSLSKRELDRERKKLLEQKFVSLYKPGATTNTVKLGDGTNIYKNAEGKFFVTQSPSTYELESQKLNQEFNEKNTEALFQKHQKKLADIYEENIGTSPGGLVEIPGFPGVKIVKGKDGVYRYQVNAAEKERMQTIIKSYKADQKDLAERDIKKPATQRVLKKRYEDELATKDIENPKVILAVIKDKDGVYWPNPLVKIESDYKKSLAPVIRKLNADHSDDPIPAIESIGSILSADQDLPMTQGKYVIKELEAGSVKPYMPEGARDNVSLNSGVVELVLKTVDKKFQLKNLNEQKLNALDKDALEAVSDYTGKGYKELNSCLRNSDCSLSQNKKVKRINQIIEQIKKDQNQIKSQILFRGTSNLTSEMKKDLKNNSGSYVMDKAFMSTSGKAEVAQAFQKGAILILKAKSCASIAGFSQISNEDEFLCPPGMKFNVKQKENKDPSGPAIYVLEEVEK